MIESDFRLQASDSRDSRWERQPNRNATIRRRDFRGEDCRMSREHRKLEVFTLADDLVVEVCPVTTGFDTEERYGLKSQLRRAAIGVPATIVEGCARRTTKDYLHFVTIALGSASEVRYLLGLAARLGLLDADAVAPIRARCDELVRALQRLVSALERPGA